MVDIITQHLDVWTSAQLTKNSVGRGSNGKQMAYGIKKLRELILELAMRGKLVPQDPNDETANIWLETISSRNNSSTENTSIKKLKMLSEIYDEEKPFELPFGWEWLRLGDLAKVIRGVTYKKHDAQEYEFEGCIPLMRANNIGHTINFNNLVYIPKHLVKEEQILVSGDLLIAISSGSLDLVGKAAKVDSDINSTFGAFCAVIRPVSPELWNYFGLFFKTPLYRLQTSKAGKGIGINNISKESLDNLLVAIPPLPEQHRIVAKVDELMALCDQLEQQQTDSIVAHQALVEILLKTLTESEDVEQLAQNWVILSEHFDTLFTTEHSIDQLKQTILQLAVMGKLVPQDPYDEPASVLLEKITEEKERLVEEGTIKNQKKPQNITVDEYPFELPKGWEFVRLFDLSNLITKGSSPKWQGVSYTEDPNDVLFITSENVGSYKLILDSRKYVEKKFNEIEPRSILEKGDYLMNIVGASIGRTAIYDLDELANINQAVCLIRIFIGFLNTQFLLHFFNSEICISYMFDKQVDNARANLSMANIAKFVIPFPPLAEQHRIVAKVDELMALCETLKAQINKVQSTQFHLADAIVEQAIA